MSAAPDRGSGCSTPPTLMRSRSLSGADSANGLRAATLSTTAVFSRALWGLWAYHNAGVRHRAALELAQRFYALAAERPDPNDRLSGEGMVGVSQHYLGDLPGARRHLEHALVGYVTPDQTSHIIRFQ